MNVFYVLILLASMALMQGLTGGTRLLFCIPAAAILSIGAIASLIDVKRRRIQPDAACAIASGLFVGYMIARGVTSPVTYLAWTDEFSIGGAFAAYLLVACCVTDPKRRLWLLGGLLILAGANLAVGARQFATGSDYMPFGFIRSADYAGRASGFYICPNHLAGYLEVVGCLAMAVAFWSRVRPAIKILFGYCAICCFGGLIMTGSRGGFLSSTAGLGAMVVLGLWRSKEKSPGTFKRALVFAVALVLLAGAGVYFGVRQSHLLTNRGSMLVNQHDARLIIWPAAIKQFETSPWIGTGAGTFLYYGRLFRDPRLQLDPIHTHNDYLQMLGEYGLAGLFTMLILLGTHVRWGWRAFKHLSLRSDSRSAVTGSNAAALNIGALAALVTMTVHSAVDFNLHIPVNAMLMAIVFAILANPGRELADAGGAPAKVSGFGWLPRLALPASGAALLWTGLPKLPGEQHCDLARIALRDNKPLVALREAELGIEQEKRNPTLYFYLGEARQTIADRTKDPLTSRDFRQAAIEPYERGVKLFPQDIRLLLRLGQALTMVGNLPEAGQMMDAALRWDPLSGRVQTYYGFYLQRAGRNQEAEAAYQKGAALAPNETAENGLKQVKQALAADSVPN